VVVGSKRTLVLLAALVIGVVAAGALYFYVNGIENRAYKGTQPVLVYVIEQNIPAGTTGQNAQPVIVQKKIPLDVRPATAVTDASVIIGKVAKTDLVQGQVLVQGMFVDKVDAVQSTFADRLGKGRIAVSVSVDQVHGVSGLLQPGDHVTMMVVLDATQAAAANGQQGQPVTTLAQDKGGALGSIQFLYQNVEILAIGTNIGTPQPANAQVAPSGGLITFAVPPAAAARIALVNSQLYLALEPTGYTATSMDPVDYPRLFKTDLLTPDTTTTTTTIVLGGPASSATTVAG
jgi:pilus assembly protein CpaB